jgi:transcriptional regulator with XRE-family HTH domain
MNKKNKRVYSHYCQDAATLLGQLIASARKEKKLTTTELAERAGISRGTLFKIEHGNLTCEIGIVFEVAAIAGISLFEMSTSGMSLEVNRMQSKLNLLPKRVHKTRGEFDDNF